MKIYGYKGKFFYHYPMKVNQNKEFIMPLLSEGANLEVTSANELWISEKTLGRGKIQSANSCSLQWSQNRSLYGFN